MIIKATRVRARGPALKRLLDHLENADDNEQVEALRGNFADLYDARQDARNFGREFCVRQWIVSPSRETSYAKMLEAVDQLASEFGFNPARAVVRGHMKTKAAGEELFAGHIHILVPEVDPVDGGRVLSSSHDWARGEKVGKILSVEWGEPLVESAKPKSLLAALKRDGRNDVAAAYQAAFPDSSTRPRPVQSFDTAAQQRLKRGGFDLPALRLIVTAAWKQAPTRAEFEMNLLEHGLVTRAGEKAGVFVIETADGKNVGSLARLAKISKAAVLAKMEQHDVRPAEEANDDAGSYLQEHPSLAEDVGADKTSCRTSPGHAPGGADLDVGRGEPAVGRNGPADIGEIGPDHRIAGGAFDREGNTGFGEGLIVPNDFALTFGLAAHIPALTGILGLATRNAMSQNERLVIELGEIEEEARIARAMIDTRPPEPASLIKARVAVSEAQRKVATAQSVVDGAVEVSTALRRPRPWWHRAIGLFTGESTQHASRMRAAALAEREALSALSQAENDRRSEENRLILVLQQHKKAVKEHIEKWTERAKAAEAKAVATARAREILQLLPGAAALGPAGLQRLGSNFCHNDPRPDGEPTFAVLF
jgi:hypothetical protein